MVDVAMQADFVALSKRVAVLEARSAGVQAARIADLVELFGVNTFSSLDPATNVWGAWPANYAPATVIAALSWLTAGSGFCLRGREYHYAGREAIQAPWLKTVTAATGARFSLCIGANGGLADVPSALALAADAANGIAWVEGINEPNNDFGSGSEPIATPVVVQKAIFAARPGQSVGPSIVIGLPFPEQYIAAYAPPDALAALNAAMAFANVHFYPPTLDVAADGSGRGGAIDNVAHSVGAAYAGHPLFVTEYHPTLYNHAGEAPGGPLDAYYGLLALLSAQRLGLGGLWWYALFDYGAVYKCGLFPIDASNPRPAAWAIRALCARTGDKGAARRTFTPGGLAVTVTGLPPPVSPDAPYTGGHWTLYEATDGRFFILLWNAQVAMGGPAVPVTVTFAAPPSVVTEYNLSLGTAASMAPLQSRLRPDAVISQLDASVRLLVIAP